jgi:hypothetical protein
MLISIAKKHKGSSLLLYFELFLPKKPYFSTLFLVKIIDYSQKLFSQHIIIIFKPVSIKLIVYFFLYI